MAVWSVVKVSELEGAKRLDAEYYRPEYLKLKRSLSKHPLLGQCVQKIVHPVEIKRVYEEEGLRILLAQNIQHNFLEFSVTVFMPESVRGLISRNRLLPNDVVITRSGANYGDAAPYFGEPAPLYACADDLVVRPKPDLPAGYLATFFNTDAGMALIKRGGYGAGQPHVAPPFLKTLHVPRFSRDVEQKIDGLLRSAREQFKQSESLYLQAERTVLDELAWDKLDLSQPKWWAASLSRACDVHRLDAEHFQPKYDKLIAHLKKTGRAKPLAEIATYIRRGLQPAYVDDGEVLVFTEKHLGRYMLNVETAERTSLEFYKASSKAQVKTGDIIMYSIGAFIGRANIYLQTRRATTSSNVTIIRPRAEEVAPEYLAVYLNSSVGLLQSQKWTASVGQMALYPTDIPKFMIYLPSENFQQWVADLVLQSYHARQKAKALLEEAKAKVEALIGAPRH